MAWNITYREYAPGDIEYVRDILEYDLDYNIPCEELEKRINEMLSRDDYRIFVACDGEKTVGFIGTVSFIAFELEKRAVKITALAVSEKYRGKGIGTGLLGMAESYCKSKGFGVITLTSGMQREKTHAFYESRGYCRKKYGFVKQIL